MQSTSFERLRSTPQSIPLRCHYLSCSHHLEIPFFSTAKSARSTELPLPSNNLTKEPQYQYRQTELSHLTVSDIQPNPTPHEHIDNNASYYK